MEKLILTLDKSAERALVDRANRLTPRGEPMKLNPVEKAILFLRGVYSRATMALPAFYLFHGANLRDAHGCLIEGYPGVVLKESLKFSSINTVTLACRKAFDSATGALTGNNFAKTSDETLAGLAEYWAHGGTCLAEEAIAALGLLRSIFRDCSKSNRQLLESDATLCRRVGLMKQHADRSAAHLSLESYEVAILDCAHVVAALAVIGEIIRSFDDPHEQPTYFDALDRASLSAARQLFPEMPDIRLFEDIEIETQSRLCWQWGVENGRQMLLERLPYAMGWY
jgi:hypothetical protein